MFISNFVCEANSLPSLSPKCEHTILFNHESIFEESSPQPILDQNYNDLWFDANYVKMPFSEYNVNEQNQVLFALFKL